ncbi:MAG TPA: hypothetical protein VL981_01695 [Candidatus Methylacidiphilales bacterium]|nr:hypothetical protein [Candidatus Methylacidiphilales bacterium]
MRVNRGDPDSRLDDHDPVWQLLARAPLPEPDGWFVVRAVARCRQAGREAEKSLGRFWRWALGGGSGVCLAAILMMSQIQTRPAPPVAADDKNVQEAFEIVAAVGPDSDSAPASLTWQDSSR